MKKRILVVDDEPAIRFAVHDYFTLHGYEVDAVSDRETAKAILLENDYRVAIVDLALSGPRGTEGLDVIRHIRMHRAATQIVLLTANGSPQIKAAARDYGAAVVLDKPMTLAGIGEIVASLA